MKCYNIYKTYCDKEKIYMENILTEQNKVLTFQEYQNWLNKWKNNNDFREINIQNEVVKPFILSICPDLDVIDVSKR